MSTSYKIITGPQSKQSCAEQPLTGLDIGNPAGGFSVALVYRKPLSELRLIDGLQKSLDRVPYFSGRVFGLGSVLPLVIPNNEGVLFSCSVRDEEIPDFSIDHPMKRYISLFINNIESAGFDHHTPLLQVHLTNFSNGSILGISISHVFCDGISMIEFIHDWANSVSGFDSRALPSWNRRDVQQMALGEGTFLSKPSAAIELFQPVEPQWHSVETSVFRLSVSLIERLYRRYGACIDGVSRQDIAMAIIFILMMRCRLAASDSCSLTIVYNIRHVLGLPANYLGNAVALLFFKLDVEQLIELEVGEAARMIRGLYAEITPDGLRRDLAFWQRKMADGCAHQFISVATHVALNGGILIDNMSKFDFYDLDFGGGKPVWIDTPPPPSPALVARGVLMLPAPPDAAGIDLHVTLPQPEMTNFRALMNGFDVAGIDDGINAT